MAYDTCQNCNGVGSNYNNSTNKSDICFSCGGIGRHWKADPPQPIPGPKPPRPGPTVTRSNPQKSAQYFMAAIAFFGTAYYVFANFNDNLIVAGIVGLIVAFIAFKWYKAIIIIAVIAGIIYFIYNDK